MGRREKFKKQYYIYESGTYVSPTLVEEFTRWQLESCGCFFFLCLYEIGGKRRGGVCRVICLILVSSCVFTVFLNTNRRGGRLPVHAWDKRPAAAGLHLLLCLLRYLRVVPSNRTGGRNFRTCTQFFRIEMRGIQAVQQ